MGESGREQREIGYGMQLRAGRGSEMESCGHRVKHSTSHRRASDTEPTRAKVRVAEAS